VRTGPADDEVHHIERNVFTIGFAQAKFLKGGQHVVAGRSGRQLILDERAQTDHQLVVRRCRREDFLFSFQQSQGSTLRQSSRVAQLDS
jgi:hypothetical protein